MIITYTALLALCRISVLYTSRVYAFHPEVGTRQYLLMEFIHAAFSMTDSKQSAHKVVLSESGVQGSRYTMCR